MRRFWFSLLIAAILSTLTTAATVLAAGPDGVVPCCH
jgi:hypothetical protein